MNTETQDNSLIREISAEKYRYGFTTDVHTDIIDRGLTEDTVRLISERKGEPEWMLERRTVIGLPWKCLIGRTWISLR